MKAFDYQSPRKINPGRSIRSLHIGVNRRYKLRGTKSFVSLNIPSALQYDVEYNYEHC